MSRGARKLVAGLLPLERAMELSEVHNISVMDYLVACREAMTMISERADSEESVLDAKFVAEVHRLFAEKVGSKDPGQWNDQPGNTSWSTFVSELNIDDPADVVASGGHVWVLNRLTWGGHVRSLTPTVGWLIMNGYLQEVGEAPVYPPEDFVGELAETLRTSGPPQWDAENLRGVSQKFQQLR